MNCFQNVKYGVSCREAAERYGVEVNYHGMALCPFHNDRHPSLYVADDHYYCFACGEHGDVIDFVSKLFRLSLYDAAQKLAADFHLTPDKPPSAAALHAKCIQTEAQQLRENERLCFSILSDYARVLRRWKAWYAPQSPADHRISGSWKPVTNSTRQNTTWIFCAQVIPMNVPKWLVICLQMVGWTNSRKKSMGGMLREQKI